MSLNEIMNRMHYLLRQIKENPEDQDCFYNSELELAYLQQLREKLEEKS